MKKAITTALLAALVASTAAQAFAQDEQRGRAGPRREHAGGSPEQARRAPEPQGQTQSAPREAPPPPQARKPFGPAGAGARIQDDQRTYRAPTPPPAPQPPVARTAPRPPDADRRDWNDRRRDDPRHDDRRWDDNRRWNDGRGWNDDHRWNDRRRPDDRNRPRYDRRYYPPVYQVPHRYRTAPYRPPAGWYSFRWSFGDTLPRGWYGPSYLIMDWYAYGLPMPPIGYEWVRVGDDAVLVDTFTGRVAQVAYNLFW